MKIKNISVGDSVQVKKRLVSNIFRAKQVCEVIKIDSEHKFMPNVLIKGEYCLEWVNHKDLKKPIHREPELQLKQLDQSIFNGLDEKWRFATVSSVGIPFVYSYKPTDKKAFLNDQNAQLMINLGKIMRIDEYNYDTTDWQNSLIERDIAKELLEVDLSSELTGSDLAKDYFKRGCCPRVCFVGEDDDECLSDLVVAMVIGYVEGKGFETSYNDFFPCAAMVNSYGDELTASEVGL